MAAPIAIVGVPTALGGHLSGMEFTPAGLRALGSGRPAPGGAGSCWASSCAMPATCAIEPGFRPDPDPRAKNRAEICAFLPRERDLVAAAIGGR